MELDALNRMAPVPEAHDGPVLRPGRNLEYVGQVIRCNDQRMVSRRRKMLRNALEKARVGVAPGIDFGPNGEGYLRFSYANSLENIKEGMIRLEKYLKTPG